MNFWDNKPNSTPNSEPQKQPKCTECGLHHAVEWLCTQKRVLQVAADSEAEAMERLKKRQQNAQEAQDAQRRAQAMRRLDAALEAQARRERANGV